MTDEAVQDKEYKIILIRHGESEGNIDHTVYEKKFDHDIELTKRGNNQAVLAGKQIHKILGEEPLDVFISPYKRTRQTWEGIKTGLERNNLSVDIDARLREQEHKMFKNSAEREKIFSDQKKMGRFWYRFSNTESGCDVYSRVSTFLTELRLDRKLFNHENDCLIVAHEIALRAILMKLFKLDVPDFDRIPDIENCSQIVINTFDFKNVSLNKDETIGNLELIKFFDDLKKNHI